MTLRSLTDLEPRTRLNPEAHTPSAYHITWKGGTEVEVADMLAGLTRALQPRAVIETGSGDGTTTVRIAKALVANGHGRLLSVEHDEAKAEQAKAALTAAKVATAYVTIGDALTIEYEHAWAPARLGIVDLAFFDGSNRRDLEYHRARPSLSKVAVVAFHDTGNGLNTREQVDALHEQGFITAPLYLPTPRGIALARVTEKRQ